MGTKVFKMNTEEESPTLAKAQIIADPTAGFPKGLQLGFASAPVLTDFNEQTATINNWEFFGGMLLMMSFSDQEKHYIEGSAVLVAPGIALCATHVIEHRIPQIMAGKLLAWCKGIATNGDLLLWNIRKVTTVGNTDFTISVLALASALPPNNVFIHARITTRTPKIGEHHLICGFRAKQSEFHIVERGSIEMEVETRLCKGAVKQVFELGRDSCMLPWPTIEVACPSMGGMSGGPVFDFHGHLIGLLTSSLEDESGGISYVSHIWPALVHKTEPGWPEGFYKNHPVSLLEMDPEICAIDKRDVLTHIANGDGTSETQYRPWQK